MRKSTKSFLVDINVWLALVYDLHVHHQPARHWFESLAANQAFFCRFTQLGLLRLLTNSKVMAKDAMTQRAAWGIYDRTMTDERVNFTAEPPAVETELRRLTQSSSGSTRVWSDVYLASFASAGGLTVATMDKAFAAMKGIDVIYLEASPLFSPADGRSTP